MAGSSATSQRSVQFAKKSLRKFLKNLGTVPTKILEKESKTLYAEIISEVPYKTGKLERSVRVSVAKDKKRPGLNASASARSSSGYNYAGIQHERTDYKHTEGRKAHYISDPFWRSIRRIQKSWLEEVTLRD